jgi:hypothetical protein
VLAILCCSITSNTSVAAPYNCALSGGTYPNPIIKENCKAGNGESEWGITVAGTNRIAGFTTQMSVSPGQSIEFKIRSVDSTQSYYKPYSIQIFRMGYYGGLGARRIDTSNTLSFTNSPTSQPNCIKDTSTGLVDCNNWSVSATWAVPNGTTSGIYFARLAQNPDPGMTAGPQSYVFFVVRDDTRAADILFKTSDTTWQAYNMYGGANLYGADSTFNTGRAQKVSYNRPFAQGSLPKNDTQKGWVFNAEYPLVRWLEANGYDVSYASGIDAETRGATLLQHRLLLSVGHDEYWSSGQRQNVEAARDAGVHLAFFSGNEMFWKVRWEDSTVASPTPVPTAHRTMVCYKENADTQPLPGTEWTGTWRDPAAWQVEPQTKPENALTGTLFRINNHNVLYGLRVSAEEGKHRFWRNTSVSNQSPGTSRTIAHGVVGLEMDEDADNGFRPPGLARLSSTPLNDVVILVNEGSEFGTGDAIHRMTLYRHASGALVFGAGTINWAWGLDGQHSRDGVPDGEAPPPASTDIQQATVNLFADMNVRSDYLQYSLVQASPSTDGTAPVSQLTSATPWVRRGSDEGFSISGTAADGEGRVAGVEVSTNDGLTWHPAEGHEAWSYALPAPGEYRLRTRAVDDSGNLEVANTGSRIRTECDPCSLWTPNEQPNIWQEWDPTHPLELGMKFKTELAGFATGVRFYAASTDPGLRTARLWDATSEALLASATVTVDGTEGWKTVRFDMPVALKPSKLYVVSYHSPVGRYAKTPSYFVNKARVSGPLTAPSSGEASGNGVYVYGNGGFPAASNGSNYWVDVLFSPGESSFWYRSTVPTVTAKDDTAAVELGIRFQPKRDGYLTALRFYKGSGNNGPHTGNLWRASDGQLLRTLTFQSESASGWQEVRLDPPLEVQAGTEYVASYHAPAGRYAQDVDYFAGTSLEGHQLHAPADDVTVHNGLYRYGSSGFPTSAFRASNYWVDVVFTPKQYSLWSPDTVPQVQSSPDTNEVEVGMKFQTAAPGRVIGLRFYKGPTNTAQPGQRVGRLWDVATQTKLREVTFGTETATGWQEARFAVPYHMAKGQVLMLSYRAPNGGYAQETNGFQSRVERLPLIVPASREQGGNGTYRYGWAETMPGDSYESSNYWVDVIFEPDL